MEREVVVEELEGAGVLGALELAAVPEISAFLQSYFRTLQASL
jgi:hypothetical protein